MNALTAVAPLRPRDLGLLLLAGEMRPRERARDQKADAAGMELKRSILREMAALDPEPDGLEAALETIVTRHQGPGGPLRSICLSVLDDWQAARTSPEFITWLLRRAICETGQERRRGPAVQP